MRYVGLLIKQIGRQTRNPRENVTATSGISDDEILQYLNDAQERLQTVILRDVPHCKYFDYANTQSLVANQEDYDLPANTFYDSFVRRVRYFPSAATDTFTVLGKITEADASRYTGDPGAYYIERDRVIVSPIPSSAVGSIEIKYIKACDRLDIRRGTLSTVNSAGGYYTTVVLSDDTYLDADAIEESEFLCVVSESGAVTYYNAEIGSYDSTTRTITFASNSCPTTGGTMTAGQYIVMGKYTTTHANMLPRQAERYLIAYASWKTLKSDSSVDSVEQNQELVAIEEDIVAAMSVAQVGLDEFEVPIHDAEWFDT